jgi:CO/xanthine dehydrogenase FAD-binding subunit
MTIIEYHRPKTLDEALALLARPEIETVPLGGGTRLNAPDYQAAHFQGSFAVVDLQALKLDTLASDGPFIEIGAAVTLQALLDATGLLGVPVLPPALLEAARLETTFNLRQVSTAAGTLVAADGRSPFATAMLALDTRLTLLSADNPQGDPLRLGDLLAAPGARISKKLITRLSIPATALLAYEYVARTPSDRPIVCAAVARWPSGRTRVCLGGYGSAPRLAMDGPEPGGAESAARAAYSQAADEWASAEYRSEIAGILTRRCLE